MLGTLGNGSLADLWLERNLAVVARRKRRAVGASVHDDRVGRSDDAMLGIGLGRSEKHLSVYLDIDVPPHRSTASLSTQVTWGNDAKLATRSSVDPLILKYRPRRAIAIAGLPIPDHPFHQTRVSTPGERCSGEKKDAE